MSRYFLDQDNRGHWRIVKDNFRSEWETWLNEDHEGKNWDALPLWAFEVIGSPKFITFTDPSNE